MLQAQQQQTDAAGRARGSSFYLAMRLLPREQREAMFEVYSFCKAVDDIADCDAPHDWRMQRLAEWRATIDALFSRAVPSGMENLARVIERYGLRKEDFLAVIEGMEMDAAEDIRAPDFDRLDLYCDRVACAVGRLSVRIFGMEEHEGRALAYHLGRALQLTNILRDIDEDAAAGRLYLPREALQQAGIQTTDPQSALASPGLDRACRVVAERAAAHFDKADEIITRSPRRVVRAPRIMKEAYQPMLADLLARGWAWPRNRVRVSRSHLLRIALQYAFI
jgi:presqualene diphosphate synthase